MENGSLWRANLPGDVSTRLPSLLNVDQVIIHMTKLKDTVP
jgi:hypothetical protein